MSSHGDASVLPKIALESINDYSYVKSVFRQAIQEKLAIHLPEQASREAGMGREDQLRIRVKEMLNELIESTFSIIQENVTINGFDANSALQDPKNSDQIEPFDLALRTRVQQLFNEVEDAHVLVARYRKSVPAQYEKAYVDAMEQQTAFLRNVKDDYVSLQDKEVENPDEQTSTTVFRKEDIDRYEQTIAKVAYLKKNLPRVVARLEKTP
ncbi:Kinetochore protein mis14 [Schizosaccharomyces pombe]|uniref:Kinetochore protein mis14 n=1 Tax=Schizosaccharomyces pombe (strain 972 / ATCC 24843) TaxID=284812 RepID=MIS14_SCHPO|nr:kinetochore protein Mis14 [Schizosaccharomyces pombe]Q9P6M3.1 RecName: Full=Kinetochore protein mis14; AltName: Full=NMS complex subunit mis14 [Schizosaccharomyces pombe 972h-]CAB90769.1 kinetochore protein Mis14 [Schizosaccharomyces pombe]|eukprot:NP_594061.1 kinetochore protein Mis14 [Schizosaccharomyces pombe]